MTILLTGATGYIGSHVWADLLQGSYGVVGIDNLSNSSIEVCSAIEKISGKRVVFIKGDIRDAEFLSQIFVKYSITHVIHLAALKNVQESLLNKDEYYDVNVNGVNVLLTVMRNNGCQKIIFSSSAAVYGDKAVSPISEVSELFPVNWYGLTKQQGEQILIDATLSSLPIRAVSLRYFNVAGKHPSGLMVNHSISASQSLFDQIEKTLKFNVPLNIFGDDWNTLDGTCVRDYIHVSDIVRGHIDALSLLDSGKGFVALNLGAGRGVSVKEVVSAFEGIIGRSLPLKVIGRRNGDVPINYADCSKAKELMGWSPLQSLSEICFDQINTAQ